MSSPYHAQAAMARRLLRSGFTIKDTEENAIEVARTLETRGILSLKEIAYVRCSNEHDPDFRYLSRDEKDCREEIRIEPGSSELICPGCGRQIDEIDHKQRRTAYQVHPEPCGIDACMGEIIEAMALEQRWDCAKMGAGSWKLTPDGPSASVHIDVPYISSNWAVQSLYSAQQHPVVFIETFRRTYSSRGPVESWRFYGIEDLIFGDVSSLVAACIRATTDLPGWGRVFHVKTLLQRLAVDDDMTPTEFEREFLQNLYEHIRHRCADVDDYLQLLRSAEGTAFGSIYVHVGGGSSPDGRQLNRRELIEAFLDGEALVDTKCYGLTSQVQLDHVRQANDYASRAGRDVTCLIVTTTDSVVGTAWSAVFDYGRAQGRYPVIIIPGSLLAELIVAVDAVGLVEAFLHAAAN